MSHKFNRPPLNHSHLDTRKKLPTFRQTLNSPPRKKVRSKRHKFSDITRAIIEVHSLTEPRPLYPDESKKKNILTEIHRRVGPFTMMQLNNYLSNFRRRHGRRYITFWEKNGDTALHALVLCEYDLRK